MRDFGADFIQETEQETFVGGRYPYKWLDLYGVMHVFGMTYPI